MKSQFIASAACVLLAATALTSVHSALAQGNVDGIEQLSGVFDDGQEWMISVPENWNGIVINDLDAVAWQDGSFGSVGPSTFLLENGYAYTGTKRHPDRNTNWDPNAESNNMVKVLDLFETSFGPARSVIQFGCSGGGSVGLSVAEDHPDRFDGVVALHASSPIELANMRLDLSVAVKALLEPDGDLPLIISDGEQAEAEQAWLAALERAMATPEGRARVALAAAVAQYPMWGSQNQPQAEMPDWNDPESVQNAMVRAVVDGIRRGVTGRPMWDQPAGLMSWTTGVDYRAFYENANNRQQELVLQMYEIAGLTPDDLSADLEKINDFPRIEATAEGVEYFRERTHTGDIGIPVLHGSGIGDGGTPAAVMAGYVAKIEAQGSGDLYRQAFMESAGHCTYNTAELEVLLTTIIDRVETGEWGDTAAAALNGRIDGEAEIQPRFIDLADYPGFALPDPFNRLFNKEDTVGQ